MAFFSEFCVDYEEVLFDLPNPRHGIECLVSVR